MTQFCRVPSAGKISKFGHIKAYLDIPKQKAGVF